MTAAERQRYRQAIDAATRERIAKAHGQGQRGGCAGCGTHLDEHTWDCVTCRERHARRKREKERRKLLQGRCQLCGHTADGAYCHAHRWAA